MFYVLRASSPAGQELAEASFVQFKPETKYALRKKVMGCVIFLMEGGYICAFEARSGTE